MELNISMLQPLPQWAIRDSVLIYCITLLCVLNLHLSVYSAVRRDCCTYGREAYLGFVTGYYRHFQ